MDLKKTTVETIAVKELRAGATKVCLRRRGIDHTAIESLTTELENNTTLQILDLCSNPLIDDEGCVHIMSMIVEKQAEVRALVEKYEKSKKASERNKARDVEGCAIDHVNFIAADISEIGGAKILEWLRSRPTATAEYGANPRLQGTEVEEQLDAITGSSERGSCERWKLLDDRVAVSEGRPDPNAPAAGSPGRN